MEENKGEGVYEREREREEESSVFFKAPWSMTNVFKSNTSIDIF